MFKARVFRRIGELPRDEWDSVANVNSCTYSSDFLELTELSDAGRSRHGYGMIYDEDDDLVAVAPFKISKTDVGIFSSGWLRKLLARIRKRFPNFLMVSSLECTVPALSKQHHTPEQEQSCGKVLQVLGKTLIEIAEDNGAFLVIIGAFEPQAQPCEACLADLGYQFVPCLPVALLAVRWTDASDYPATMKSYYRSKLQKHLRINQSNAIRHELRESFAGLAEVLWQQWRVVREHAKECDDEELTPDFYRHFSEKLGTNSKVLLIYAGETLVGHALLLLDGETLRWRNFGRVRAANDSLYIYAGHKVVEVAISLGVKHLDLGVTTYEIKRDLGASIVPRRIAIRISWRPLNQCSVMLYSFLNHIPVLKAKNIFKAGAGGS